MTPFERDLLEHESLQGETGAAMGGEKPAPAAKKKGALEEQNAEPAAAAAVSDTKEAVSSHMSRGDADALQLAPKLTYVYISTERTSPCGWATASMRWMPSRNTRAARPRACSTRTSTSAPLRLGSCKGPVRQKGATEQARRPSGHPGFVQVRRVADIDAETATGGFR